MGLEFDPRCCTAQPEDRLVVQIPAGRLGCGVTSESEQTADGEPERLVTLLTLSGGEGWPRAAVLLPGEWYRDVRSAAVPGPGSACELACRSCLVLYPARQAVVGVFCP